MDYVEQRVAQEAKKLAEQPPTEGSFFTPLNIILLAVVAYTLYTIFRPTPPPAMPREAPATVFQTFTPPTLINYDGKDGKPVYLAVRGRVFDVTAGRNFYGPGGPYENFAGRDASRGLANHSFDQDMLTLDLNGPLDKLDDLGPDEMDALRDWEERFESKYLVVGRLVAVGDEEKK
ncbi:hypothetical protein MCOR25_009107 [Pyricularia grisea]|uniref:Cytochrome b5 heme-binding domain-containing protein n=1 Tax=Pyricularia grisea TaxID=148305 RepID=A0A6P8AN83_PYRGI|nr:uncharacterized protein PgNI_11859 [Pyricularia grisea]KAI6353210.1 hypothetical protein MCOR25_009107 [Pyricularia grisea]TLD03489.1 hypothetical protein PgNI_11859 [Pyricularia grisea]